MSQSRSRSGSRSGEDVGTPSLRRRKQKQLTQTETKGGSRFAGRCRQHAGSSGQYDPRDWRRLSSDQRQSVWPTRVVGRQGRNPGSIGGIAVLERLRGRLNSHRGRGTSTRCTDGLRNNGARVYGAVRSRPWRPETAWGETTYKNRSRPGRPTRPGTPLVTGLVHIPGTVVERSAPVAVRITCAAVT